MRWIPLVVLAFLAPHLAGRTVGADAEDDALAARVHILVRGLESPMGAARSDAADALSRLGVRAVPHLVPHLPVKGGAAGEQALWGAFRRIGIDRVLGALVGHRTRWQYGDPDALTVLVEELWLELASAKATRASLAWSRLTDPSVLPRDLVGEIRETLPEAVTGRRVLAENHGNDLVVRLDDPVTIRRGKPRVLQLGCDVLPRPVVVWNLGRHWFAGPAAVASAQVGDTRITLLDGDLDGTLRGPADRIRIGSGGFQPLRRGELIWLLDAPARVEVVVGEGGAPALQIVALPLPGTLASQQHKAFTALNRWRSEVGLGAQYPDLPRCRACALHAAYYQANGYSGHDEEEGRRGYTQEGARAGQLSCCSPNSAPEAMVRSFARTILHRSCLVSGAEEPMGVGSGSSGGCIWGAPPAPGPPRFVLVPSPGQHNVPLACRSESPVSDSEPELYRRSRGYPISIGTRSGFRGFRDLHVELFAIDRPGVPLSGFLFTPERPYHSRHSGNKGSVHFVPRTQLRGKTTYGVRFTASHGELPIEVLWIFTTR